MAGISAAVEKFTKATTQVKVVALLLITVFLGSVFYFVFYSDLSDEVRRLDQQVVVLQGEKAKYEDRKQRYRAFRAEVNKLLEEQKELLKVLPDEANISTLLQSIHAQAELSGVNILTYDQQGEIRRNFYAQIPVRMTISGSYPQIQRFFYNLQKDVKRIIKIENLLLGYAKGGALQAQFVASTFRFVGKRPG